MRLTLWAAGLVSALSLATVASATTCATDTWCFGTANGFVSQGNTYSSALGSISVFSEQITNSNGDIVTHPYDGSLGTGSQALFQVTGSDGNGIAPYNPIEGSGSNFQNQDGITDTVTYNSYGYTTSTYGNVLEIELGSNIAQGTSLSFLLQAGPFADNPSVEVYYADASTPQNVNSTSMTYDLTTTKSISDTSTSPQFTITKNTSGVEFVAIEADCHYLLLDTITGVPSAVPEPRFYGLMLAGLLGVAGLVYQRRRKAEVIA